MATYVATISESGTTIGADFASKFSLSGDLKLPTASDSSTDIGWTHNGSIGGVVDSWSFDLTGSGFVPNEKGGFLTDVTGGTLTGLTYHENYSNGLIGVSRTADYSVSGLSIDANHLFDLIFANKEKAIFNLLTHGNDHMTGSAFDDTVSGGGGKDVVSGGGGNDVLDGGSGADSVLGGSGDDNLIGGTGHDTLTGGSGNDVFVIDSKVTAANSDSITDFAHGTDSIALSHHVMAGLGTLGVLAASHFTNGAATTSAQHILYDAASGWVSYDSDGSGAAAAVHLVHVNPDTTLTAADFVVM